MDINIKSRIRGAFLDLFPAYDEDTPIHASGQGEMLVANAAAPYQEIVRQGHSYCCNTTTAVASVTALPTTACGFALYNNEPDGGRSYVIDRVWAMYTVNSAALPHVGIIGLLGQVRETAPTDARPTNGLQQLSGFGTFDTLSRFILTATALPATTGIAAYWKPMGSSVNGAVTSLPGFAQVYDVNGRFIVPPGRYFAVHTLSSVTSTSAQLGIEWTEKLLLVR